MKNSVMENGIVLVTPLPVEVNRAVPFDKREILDFFQGKIRIMQFVCLSLRFNFIVTITRNY